jgi:hypothetical protein
MLDIMETMDVQDRRLFLRVVEEIVEEMGGTVEIDWQENIVNINIAPGKEMECCEALEKAYEWFCLLQEYTRSL